MIEGDKIQLKNQEVEVVGCQQCGHVMVNLDAPQVAQGDLTILKKEGVRISNPTTEAPVCLDCELDSGWHKLRAWWNTPVEIDSSSDDDSSFFGGFGGSFGGFSGSGRSGGGSGFGGFGGGSFSGGGASGGF